MKRRRTNFNERSDLLISRTNARDFAPEHPIRLAPNLEQRSIKERDWREGANFNDTRDLLFLKQNAND
jgi:hypothetical protein